MPRGPWRYDGEIDLGFGGALRMAATIVTNDPLFGWIAYGGALRAEKDSLVISPRDGLRQRFVVALSNPQIPWASKKALKIELDRDGFASGESIALDTACKKVAFTLENRTGDDHTTGLWLSLPEGDNYEVEQDGKPVTLVKTGVWDYPLRAELSMHRGPSKVEIKKQ